MNCPVCREPMVVLELDEVEIDHCLECGGIWLDEGELELLLESTEEKKEILTSFQIAENISETARRCPICLKKMNKVWCGRKERVLIDKCPRNHGLWFDRGELYQVIEMGTIDKNNKVLMLLKEMFKEELKKGGRK